MMPTPGMIFHGQYGTIWSVRPLNEYHVTVKIGRQCINGMIDAAGNTVEAAPSPTWKHTTEERLEWETNAKLLWLEFSRTFATEGRA